ncbi:MAG: hypothetical protein ACLFPE_11600 [Bacteroidales bacterium]
MKTFLHYLPLGGEKQRYFPCRFTFGPHHPSTFSLLMPMRLPASHTSIIYALEPNCFASAVNLIIPFGCEDFMALLIRLLDTMAIILRIGQDLRERNFWFN